MQKNTNTHTTTTQNRIEVLDTLRGIAVVLMIAFHFCYDLNDFGYSNFDMFNNIYWEAFRAVIVGLFAFCVGYSFHISHKNATYINIKKFKSVLLRLFISACLVSIATYAIFPDEWIYFGILHFILLSYFLLFFVYWLENIYLLILAFGLFILNIFDVIDGNFIIHFAVRYLDAPHKTLDMVAFIPWFCIILIGLICSKLELLQKIKLNTINILSNKSGINFLGRHALFIYLIHQIIMFGLFEGFIFVTNTL